MDALTPVAVQAIAGLLGGGIAGNLMDVAAIRTPPKVLVSLIGGVAGGALAGLALGVGAVAVVAPDPAVTADVTSRVNFAGLGAWVGGGLIGGGLLTTVSGAIGLGR
ncbi:hypothetical protein [Amaricoccus solimangrovi]|uniref:Uncharacterized protein n=1 Tax=Amaricoccus solimangrovi TaxID=2589815 RepID=A0A501WV26_9RHOB|nr:hypothetical protein [Amaricoccus solimangrovi]TPE53129.1 hypothetical protein FJM51_03650 [Amaricoccus solimangrovi]